MPGFSVRVSPRGIQWCCWFCILGIVCVVPIAAESESGYPIVGRLDPSDVLFRQLSDSIAQSLAAEQTDGRFPDLIVARYVVPSDTDVFSIAARLNLPYETVATINRLGSSVPLLKGREILLPSITGIFLVDTPANDLEFLMHSWRSGAAPDAMPATIIVAGASVSFRLFTGSRFHPAERAYFLNAAFRFPLPKARLTSGFGFRASPFSGKAEMHRGIDLAAPLGMDVHAARSGVVSMVGVDAVYGLYVLLTHEGGWETLYGHLSSTTVRLKDSIKSGMMVGKVGSTGASTGPHLHFEVRLKGEPHDPATVLPRIGP